MMSSLVRSRQSSLLSRDVEVRKVPGHQKEQISVFCLAVNLLMHKRQEPLRFVQVRAGWC